MWGNEEGTAGDSSQPLQASDLPGTRSSGSSRPPTFPQLSRCSLLLHLPGPGGCPACSGVSAGGRDAKELVWLGRAGAGVGAGSAQPTQVWPRRLRQQSSAPGWPRLAGWQEPPEPLAAPGRAGTPRHYPTAAAGAARAGRGRQGRHGQVGRGTEGNHRPPAPGPDPPVSGPGPPVPGPGPLVRSLSVRGTPRGHPRRVGEAAGVRPSSCSGRARRERGAQ